MNRLRAAIRTLRLVGESLTLFSIYSVGRPLLAFTSLNTQRAWRRFMYQWWARSVTRCFAIVATYEGEIPRGAFVLAANHQSYVDIPVLAQRVDAAFIAKREVRRWPGVGVLAASVGTIFVNRESRRDALRVGVEIERVVSENRGVALFPEGTATDGSTLLPFKPTLLDVAARNRIPVYSAALTYDTGDPRYPASHFVAWGNDDDFAAHAWRLLQVRRVRARVRFGPARISSDRKELAQQLWDDVNERLTRE